jgi:hypothetical protein
MTFDDAVEIFGDDLMTMDGFDDCIVGIATGKGRESVIIYDREKVIHKLMNDGMTYEEAEEYHDYNQADAWVGEKTPMFLTKIDQLISL